VDGSHQSSVKHRVAVVNPGQDETAGQRLRELGCEQMLYVTDVRGSCMHGLPSQRVCRM